MKKHFDEDFYPSFDDYMKDKDKYDYLRTFENQMSLDYSREDLSNIASNIREINGRAKRTETIIQVVAVVGVIYILRKPLKKFIRKTLDYFKSWG